MNWREKCDNINMEFRVIFVAANAVVCMTVKSPNYFVTRGRYNRCFIYSATYSLTWLVIICMSDKIPNKQQMKAQFDCLLEL